MTAWVSALVKSGSSRSSLKMDAHFSARPHIIAIGLELTLPPVLYSAATLTFEFVSANHHRQAILLLIHFDFKLMALILGLLSALSFSISHSIFILLFLLVFLSLYPLSVCLPFSLLFCNNIYIYIYI